MYFKLQTAHAMLLNVDGKIGNWKIVKEHQIDNVKRFRVRWQKVETDIVKREEKQGN